MIHKFLTVEQYSEAIFKNQKTIIGWIKNQKAMPGVVNVWRRPEGYVVQWDGTFKPRIIQGFTRIEEKEEPKIIVGNVTTEEMKQYDYMMQRERLKRRLKKPDKYWIVEEMNYVILVKSYLKNPIKEYINAGIQLPGVERIYKNRIHYFELKKGYDFENIPDDDLRGIRAFEDIKRKSSKKKELLPEEILAQQEREYYMSTFGMFKRAYKKIKKEDKENE